MPSYALTSAWTRVASAGQAVEVENLSLAPVTLLLASSAPATGAVGEILLRGDRRDFAGAPLAADLYACSANGASASLVVQLIGISAGGGPATVADGADATQGSRGDAVAAGPSASASVVSILKGLWATLQGTLQVSPAGSAGADASANAPATPVVGAAFGATGPYAGYVLVRTVAASPTRLNADVENLSGAQIVVVRDDGTAAPGVAPANASVFALAGGAAAGQQGGAWSTTTFKGRLQVYAPSAAAQVTIMLD